MLKTRNSSFQNIYRELQALAKFLKDNYEYYHHLPEINEAKKHGDTSIFNKYNNAVHSSHTRFIQFWWFLDVDTQMAANGATLSDKIMQNVPCSRPDKFRKVAMGLKHIEKRLYIYSYGLIGRKHRKYHHIDRKHLPDNYPLIIKPWPEKWFTDFDNEYIVKREMQYYASSSSANVSSMASSAQSTTTQAPDTSASISIDSEHKSIASLTKICRSLRHLSQQESSAISYLTESRDYYRHLVSYTTNPNDKNEFAKASAASSIHPDEALVERSMSFMRKASLSASASYSNFHSAQVAEVAKACNITSQAVANAQQASLSANAIHAASLANRKNDLSAIDSLESANIRLKRQSDKSNVSSSAGANGKLNGTTTINYKNKIPASSQFTDRDDL